LYLPKNGEIALWLPTNMSIVYILVLAGREWMITEITEYTHKNGISPMIRADGTII